MPTIDKRAKTGIKSPTTWNLQLEEYKNNTATHTKKKDKTYIATFSKIGTLIVFSKALPKFYVNTYNPFASICCFRNVPSYYHESHCFIEQSLC